MNRLHFLGSLALAGLASAHLAHADANSATLTLDGLSFVSFANEHVYSIPPGSTIRFRLGTPNRDSIPITVEPEDIHMGPLRLQSSGDAFMQFALVKTASGQIRRALDGGAVLELEALISVILNHPEHGGSKTLWVQFTTETAEATAIDGMGKRSITGMRVPSGAKAIQLVGASVNDSDDYPNPGTAVLTVLSGAFDQLPSVP
jgi:hypothetical protein